MRPKPEWLAKYKRPGTIIKDNGTYWGLYSNKSVRVPGKKNPQPIQKYIGKVTEDGVLVNVEINIDKPNVRIYEYGLSYVIKTLIREECYPTELPKELQEKTFLRMIQMLSQRSYLLKGEEDLGAIKECWANQMLERFLSYTGLRIEAILPLSEIMLLDFGEVKALSYISERNKKLLTSLNISLP